MFTCGLNVVYMWFTERIQASFALHPCTKRAVKDERRHLEASFKC